MIYPDLCTLPLPNEDLPQDCAAYYAEARSIADKSPRAAAALLRLCIEKLAIYLEAGGKDLNEGIGRLVKDGLPRRIQQALDVVRVIGNNAVHPGEISVEDDLETVGALFGLVNIIVDDRITQPRQLEALYERLPEGAKEAVEKRDQEPSDPGNNGADS